MEKKRDPFFKTGKNQNKSQDPFTSKKQNKSQFANTEQRSDQSKNKHDNVIKKQDMFDKNRNGLENKQDKQPFDKKAYRLKKYSKKYKLEQWEEQRKKKMLHRYQKDLKDLPATGTYKPKSFDEDMTDSNHAVGRYVRHPDIIEKAVNDTVDKEMRTVDKDPYRKAKEQFNKIKQEKAEKKKEVERVKEERKQKLQEYKKKKHERFKKLSKKTKKGQPVMTGRLELLLEKIQQG